MNPKFEGQVALVTGASRGIGAAIALELAQRGLKVIGTATTDEGAARITATLSAHAGCRGAMLDVNNTVRDVNKASQRATAGAGAAV